MNHLKVIFLDNDGVICLSNNWGSRFKKSKSYSNPNPGGFVPVEFRFDNFDKKSVEVLNKIVEDTNADIVVSSDWRYHATLDELGEYYLSQGIIKKPIGVTSFTKDIDPKWWSTFKNQALLEHERVIEIKHWLSLHPEVSHWVAVDDLNLGIYDPITKDIFNNEGLTNFVHTRKSNEGIKQTGIKDKIIKHLT